MLLSMLGSVAAPATANEANRQQGYGNKYAAVQVWLEHSPGASNWSMRRITTTRHSGSRGGSASIADWKLTNGGMGIVFQNGASTTSYSDWTSGSHVNSTCYAFNWEGCVTSLRREDDSAWSSRAGGSYLWARTTTWTRAKAGSSSSSFATTQTYKLYSPGWK